MKLNFQAFFWMITIGLSCLTGFTHASTTSSSYTAEVPVENQSAFEREMGLAKACNKVLVQVGATESVLTPTAKAMCNTPDSYIKQFSYKKDSSGKWLLSVQFHESMINQLLHSQRKHIWHLRRPVTVVWLMVEKGQTRTFVGGENQPEITKYLEEWATKNNMPLIVPSWDLTDLNQVNMNDIVAFDLAVLQKAAKRYEAEALIVGVLKEESGWQARWMLPSDKGPHFGKSEGKGWQSLLSEMLEKFLQQQRVKGGTQAKATPEQTTLLIAVNNVGQAERYSKVLAYLRSLVSASEVELKEIVENQVVFRLRVASREDFIEQLTRDHILLPEKSDNNNTEKDILTYTIP